MRVDVYECDNHDHKFAAECGSRVDICPYCGIEGIDYLYTSEIVEPSDSKYNVLPNANK